MKRKIIENLVAWKNKPNRMPLIVNGARQVGKTYIIKEFGKLYYNNTVYINLEINSAINTYFQEDISSERIIKYLEVVSGQKITPGETLIIFDEIQSSGRALASLKVFCEESPQYHIIAAGSLLGVALNADKTSFPVGKVNELSLFPFDFEEFLWALGKETLAEEIKIHYLQNKPLPEVLHFKSIEIYKYYLIIGGMPAVINEYISSQSLFSVSEVLARITDNYIADMAKYASNTTAVKIRACYNSIPIQLAKENSKFQYKVVQKGGTATIFGEAIEWLNFASIVLKCIKTEHGFMPLASYSSLSDFKLYMGDVGILIMKSGMAHQTILSDLEDDNIFIGAINENYVAQSFASKGYSLYYWKNENTAELDFVLQKQEKIIPIEVKSGRNTKSVSMKMFAKKYSCEYSIRISKKNFGFENNIKSVPLYAVFCI